MYIYDSTHLYDYVIDSSLGISHTASRIDVASQERGAVILLDARSFRICESIWEIPSALSFSESKNVRNFAVNMIASLFQLFVFRELI